MAQSKTSGSLIGKIGSYLQIVTKDPRSTAFVPLAEAYRQIGLLDDALEAASLGTRMLPHFSPGFSTLGRILGQMGRIDESMSAYAKALSLDRQSQSALVGLARLHLVRTERDQARKILKQAAEFHPEDEMVQNMLMALDLPRPWSDLAKVPEIHAPDVAPTDVESTTAEEPIPTATLAEIYVKQGLVDKAIKIYQDIVRQRPENADARMRLAELLSGSAQSPSAEISTPPVAEVVATPVAKPVPVAEVNVQSSEALPAEPLDELKSESVDKSPLAVMERWLAVLHQRREHV